VRGKFKIFDFSWEPKDWDDPSSPFTVTAYLVGAGEIAKFEIPYDESLDPWIAEDYFVQRVFARAAIETEDFFRHE